MDEIKVPAFTELTVQWKVDEEKGSNDSFHHHVGLLPIRHCAWHLTVHYLIDSSVEPAKEEQILSSKLANNQAGT